MPLESKAIEWIFARMLVRYGTTWSAKWAGVDMAAVAQDWALELENIQPYALKYAMGFLPLDFPPTAGQFKAICCRAPDRTAPAITDDTKADPARVAAVVGSIKFKRMQRGPREWARDLSAREKRGDRLTMFQKFAWREALRTEPPAGGACCSSR